MYDVKHDECHKARLGADGHLTNTPVESVYYGVVSLRGILLLAFIADINKIETWATDIVNAYIKVKTLDKVYIISGTDFGNREGDILIIAKALYGIQYSGLRRNERFAVCIIDMGYCMCKLEPDI